MSRGVAWAVAALLVGGALVVLDPGHDGPGRGGVADLGALLGSVGFLTLLLRVRYQPSPSSGAVLERRRVVDLTGGGDAPSGEVVVRRPFSVVDPARTYQIHYENRHVCSIWPLTSVRLRVAAGEATVQASLAVVFSDKVTVAVEAGEVVRLRVWNESPLGEYTSERTLHLETDPSSSSG